MIFLRTLHGTDNVRLLLKEMENTFSVPTAVGVYLEILFKCAERMFLNQRQDPKKAFAVANFLNATLAISRKVIYL
jgi:hypothetical protein